MPDVTKKEPQPHFAGFLKPTTDFDAVLTRLREPVRMWEVDLTNARSIAAGTQLSLPIAGNTLYIDQGLDVGSATLRIQDDRPQGAAKVYVQPGFVINVPFTFMLVENLAQPGKVLRILYGTDIDFLAGLSGLVNIGTVSGPVKINDANGNSIDSVATFAAMATAMRFALVQDGGFSFGAVQKSGVNLAVNATEQIFAAASNVNGAIVWESEVFTTPAVPGHIEISLHAHTVAPTVYTDGDVLATFGFNVATAAGVTGQAGLNAKTKRIAAGKGLWWANFGGQAEAAARRKVMYSLL